MINRYYLMVKNRERTELTTFFERTKKTGTTTMFLT